ncbi:MAG: hypothetical protein KAR55_02775 [Thermoplasmatales archaeon]|nr:hypothetical protein [Thermoplasmatales archaeon]
MGNKLLEQLLDKSITKEQLADKVIKNFDLLPDIVNGMNSPKATIRYGCGKILMDLSEEYPEKIYPHWDFFVNFLDSEYRILTWQAMAIIANLTKVDIDNKFDTIFEKYYDFINNDYMVTVANVIGYSSKIALAKPHLIQRITNEMLKVENLSITPHLTEECKRVIAEKTIESIDTFFDQVEQKEMVISFVEKHRNSSRKTLKTEAEKFLEKWNK